MYFLPSIRGIGLGNEMIEKCLDLHYIINLNIAILKHCHT